MQVDGDLSSVSSSISSSNQGVDEVSDLVVDNNNNIYITGSTFNVTTGYDMLLIKLDEDLNLEWSVEWDGDGMTDKGSGVRVAPNGDVYIAGTTETSSNGDDVVLVKYNSSGTFVWEETYNGEDNGDDGSDL